MTRETEYKGFRIGLRLQDSAWIATIVKRDGASLRMSLPDSNDCQKQSLDTPPQDSAIDPMRRALNVIDTGGVL